MREQLTEIEIGEKSYPIKFDNYVLSKVQEECGTVEIFENELVWFKEITDKKGKKEIINKEPSIKMINMVLPIMIEEGMQIREEETGEKIKIPDAKEIVRNIDIPFLILAKMIHKEFRKCFATKKYNPRETEKK